MYHKKTLLMLQCGWTSLGEQLFIGPPEHVIDLIMFHDVNIKTILNMLMY